MLYYIISKLQYQYKMELFSKIYLCLKTYIITLL